MSKDVVLESAALRLSVRPQVGGTITAIRHKATGLSVLGDVPWEPLDAPLESGAAPDERIWLTRYTGGWPLLFPNGGDACMVDGVFHGFHGEASISPWTATLRDGTINLERRMTTVPVHMVRAISIEDDTVTVREVVRNEGAAPVAVMWGHHPTFGSDLLSGEFEITAGARRVTADTGYDPAANPLRPGAIGRWPMVEGKVGMIDLRRPMIAAPAGRIAALTYLTDFEAPWIAIRRMDDAIAVALSWDATIFPSAWMWLEIGGTPDAPWDGRTRLIGLEPNTTPLAYGLAEARRQGARLMTLEPNVPVEAEIRLKVFKPSGRISGTA
jgi:galactose mutarotase-like enzyme